LSPFFDPEVGYVRELDNLKCKEEEEEEDTHDVSKRARVRHAFTATKKVFAKIFEVLWNFSGFFLPAAASIPFVGAGVDLLAKAINLLIDTTKNYHEIFQKASQIFEHAGFFSMRFAMLQEAENAGAKLDSRYVSVFFSV